MKDGLGYYCKECRSKLSKAYGLIYRQKNPYNPKRDKNNKLKYAYGIDLVIYNEILKNQNNKCAICGTESTGKRKNFSVDHCHKTGKVRGLLCSNCNAGIGNLRDDITLLEKAIWYLKQVAL